MAARACTHPDVEEASLQPGHSHGNILDSLEDNLCIEVLCEGALELALHQFGSMQQVLIPVDLLRRNMSELSA